MSLRKIYAYIGLTMMICLTAFAFASCSKNGEVTGNSKNDEKLTQVISHSYAYLSADQMKEMADIVFVGIYRGGIRTTCTGIHRSYFSCITRP